VLPGEKGAQTTPHADAYATRSGKVEMRATVPNTRISKFHAKAQRHKKANGVAKIDASKSIILRSCSYSGSIIEELSVC